MQTLHLPLLKKREIAHNTYEFSFPKPSDFSYTAGQYVSLCVEKPEVAGPNGTMRELSLVSAPHEKTLDLALRFRESKAKQQFLQLKKGDYAYLQGPFGSFQLEKKDKPIVLLAGGIGIAPLLSLLKDALHSRWENKFFLFFSNRRQIDIPYYQELQNIVKAQSTVSFIPTLTTGTPVDWQYETGYITPETIKHYVSRYEQASYYISGPVRFVGGMWEILAELQIPERHIRGEEFTGY